MEVSEEKRLAFWEDLYSQRGFAKWFGAFQDHLTDREANKAFSDFNANKIRQRLDDPVIAEKLIPKDHGFGLRRLPLETNYFEVYNKPNVRLIDYKADCPIESVNEKGVLLASEEQIDLDVLIYATGFDAVTGALLRGIDMRGRNGITLSQAWEDRVKTYLGLFVKDFPNMSMIMGPHQAFGNIPRSIEFAVDSVSRLMKFCKDNDITWAEATEDGVEYWTVSIHVCTT
jgi:cation diffusion facilitator CzcD-associated flavoprotein CzcO